MQLKTNMIIIFFREIVGVNIKKLINVQIVALRFKSIGYDLSQSIFIINKIHLLFLLNLHYRLTQYRMSTINSLIFLGRSICFVHVTILATF